MSDEVFYLILFLGWSLIGWIFVGVAVHTKRYQQRKEETERTPVTGEIVDVVKKVHRSGRGVTVTYYVPVVEFTANQQTYRLENENGSREKEKIVTGKSVDILYDEHDPTHFHLTEDDANEVSSGSLMRFGLILIGGAAVLDLVCMYFHLLR